MSVWMTCNISTLEPFTSCRPELYYLVDEGLYHGVYGNIISESRSDMNYSEELTILFQVNVIPDYDFEYYFMFSTFEKGTCLVSSLRVQPLWPSTIVLIRRCK